MTHAKIQSESIRAAHGITGNPTGEVVHHDLKKDGTITYYNLKFGNRIINNVPARLVESVNEIRHEHEEKE